MREVEASSRASAVQSEIRTFLIVDVRGYTRFTLERGDEAAAQLAARFAELVEETVAAWSGRVVELRGDEALSVFTSARQGLRAAVALQERFARETKSNPSLPFAVGMGLDAGEAIPVKGGYRGTALNLAARLCKLAQGGEVLASEGIVHLARKTDGISYVDRGESTLKGFDQPVRLVQVLPADRIDQSGSTVGVDARSGAQGRRFEVLLLGPFALSRDGRTLDTGGWQRRMESLFKVIATAPNRRLSRDQVVELLWPEAPPQSGAGNLRLVAHLLRRALGEAESSDLPSPLRSERGWIGLDPAYSWDVDLDRFERLLKTAGDNIDLLEEAATLYRGPPLSEDLYAEWAAPIRERIGREWRGLCLRLAGLHLGQGSEQVATGWYERALEADPLDEEAMRGLLQTLAKLGRATEALRRFRRFQQQLVEEIGVPPGDDTLAVVQELGQMLGHAPAELPVELEPEPVEARVASVEPTYPLPVPGPLRGRQEELGELLALLPGSAPSGAGLVQIALVAAEAGMGKTRLISEVAGSAGERGLLVLAGGCYEEEGRLPYGPVHDALLDYLQAQAGELLESQLGELLPILAEIVPELRGYIPDLPEVTATDPQAQRLRLFSTIAQAMQRISADVPLVLLLDDLHWADDPTIQLLHFLLRQKGLQRALIVGAYRSDEVAPGTSLAQLVARVGEASGTRLVPLQPLSESDMGGLISDRLGGECDLALAATLHQRSSGNPFFSVQMMRLLGQEGSLHQAEGQWSLAPGARVDLPPAVRETVARRLRHIAPEARNILALGSVLGREFDYVALETTADLPEDALFEALDAAHDASLLRETGSGYAFVHPLLWEVIYGRVPDQRRRRLHDRAGLALEALYGEASVDRAAELAWHFLEAGNAPHALHYTIRAAQRAERVLAYGEAESNYRSAIRLSRELGDRSREAQALEGLGGVLKAQERLDEAVEALEEAALLYRALGDLDGEGRATAQDALAHYFRGTFEQGLEFVQPVLRRVEARDGDQPSHALATLYAALPRLYGHSGFQQEELRTAERAAELGRAVGDAKLVAAAYLRQGTALTSSQRPERALEDFQEALRLAEPAEDLFTVAAASAFASDIYMEWGRIEEALVLGDRAFTAAERRGGLEQLAGIFGRAYLPAWRVGKWDRAVDYCERFIALQQSLRGEVTQEVPLLRLGEVALYRGRFDEAQQYFHQCEAVTGEATKAGRRIQVAILLMERDLLDDRPQAALDRLSSVPDRAPLASNQVDRWRFDRREMRVREALALAELERLEEPTAIVQQLMEDDEVQRDPCFVLDVQTVQAVVLAQRGCCEEARRDFGEVVALGSKLPYPLGEARALLHWGSLSASTGPAAARQRLEKALDLFQQLGAKPYADKTERKLAALTSA